jgi:large subunit ribosomal protein L7/L12
MTKVEQIVDELKGLSLLEASELVKAIEDAFGVSAAAPVATVAPAPTTGATPVVEEKTSFNVKVGDTPADKKIAVIKAVKTILNIGLADAKTKVESGSFVIAENVDKDTANKYKNDLTAAGATVSLE